MNNFLSAVLLFLLMTGTLPASGCNPGVPSVEIESAEALLSPILVGGASVFMQIRNSGTGGDSLVGAQLDIPSAVVELHDMEDGKMVIRKDIPIPANSMVRLRPFGQHIMIFRLPGDTKAGDTLSLSLLFKKSGKKTVAVTLVTNYSSKRGSPR